MYIYSWGLQYFKCLRFNSADPLVHWGHLQGLDYILLTSRSPWSQFFIRTPLPAYVYCMYKCLCVCLRDCIQSCQCMCVYCMCSIGASYLTMPCSAKPHSTNHNQPSYIHPNHSRPVRLHPSYTHLIKSHNYPILSHISVEVLGWLRRD